MHILYSYLDPLVRGSMFAGFLTDVVSCRFTRNIESIEHTYHDKLGRAATVWDCGSRNRWRKVIYLSCGRGHFLQLPQLLVVWNTEQASEAQHVYIYIWIKSLPKGSLPRPIRPIRPE